MIPITDALALAQKWRDEAKRLENDFEFTHSAELIRDIRKRARELEALADRPHK